MEVRKYQHLCGVDKPHVICHIAKVSSFFPLEGLQQEKR